MNLLNPGPGDLLDRLTILARKIVERPERADFQKEFDEIAEMVFQLSVNAKGGAIIILAAINAALWQREDEIRRFKILSSTVEGFDFPRAARVAFEIQDLNDRRAELVAEINGTEGEKLYK